MKSNALNSIPSITLGQVRPSNVHERVLVKLSDNEMKRVEVDAAEAVSE